MGVESRNPGPVLHGPGLGRHHLGVLEQASGPRRGPQAIALAHQSGRVEGLCPGVDPTGRLPAKVHLESVAGLPVRQPFEGLEDHDRRHHSGRHGGPTLGGVGVAVGEVVVSEHGMTVVGQQPIDRPLPQAVTEDLPRIVEALLDLCRPECHASNSCRTGRKSRAFGCDYFSSLLELRQLALKPRTQVVDGGFDHGIEACVGVEIQPEA